MITQVPPLPAPAMIIQGNDLFNTSQMMQYAVDAIQAAPAAEVVASDEQRDTFETYMVGTLKFPVGRSELTGSYKDSTTRMCWHVWRKAFTQQLIEIGRAALASRSEAPL